MNWILLRIFNITCWCAVLDAVNEKRWGMFVFTGVLALSTELFMVSIYSGERGRRLATKEENN